MEIYQRILGLKFTKLDDMEVWHDDVQVYKVEDNSSGQVLNNIFCYVNDRKAIFCEILLGKGQKSYI